MAKTQPIRNLHIGIDLVYKQNKINGIGNTEYDEQQQYQNLSKGEQNHLNKIVIV